MDLAEMFRARRRHERSETALPGRALFGDGRSTPCIIHDLSPNGEENGCGMRVELVGHRGEVPPEFVVHIPSLDRLIRYRPA
ncbi:MAG: hypothetical protein PGN34_23865 [Methylobacterium frigidaeris]